MPGQPPAASARPQATRHTSPESSPSRLIGTRQTLLHLIGLEWRQVQRDRFPLDGLPCEVGTDRFVEVPEPGLVGSQETQHVAAVPARRTPIEDFSRRLPPRARIRLRAVWIVRTQDDQFRLRLVHYVAGTCRARMN